jgi:DNA ligase (NAD+)
LKIDPKTARLDVRGEIYISKRDFVRINDELEEAGLSRSRIRATRRAQCGRRISSSRSVSARTLPRRRRRRPAVVTQWAAYAMLESSGCQRTRNASCVSLDDVIAFIEEWREKRPPSTSRSTARREGQPPR